MKTLSAAPHLTRNFLNMQIWMSMTEDTKIKTYSAAPHMTRNFPNISIWMSIAEDTQRSKPFQLRLTWRDKIFSEHLVSMNELIKVRLDENLFSCSSSDKKFSEHLNLNEHGRGHSDENPFSCSSRDNKFSEPVNMNEHARVWMSTAEDTLMKTLSAASHVTINFPNM